MKRLLVVAAALLAALSIPASDAAYVARTSNPVSVTAASATSYFHIYSKATLPAPDPGCWFFQYAPRRGSNPEVLAGSGSDLDAAVHLGGWRGQQGLARCVLVIRVPDALPAGASQITLHGSVGADAATGRRPVTGVSFRRANTLTNADTIALTPGQQASIELSVDLSPGYSPANRLYTQLVRVWATFSGNGDDYFAYDIPVKVYDGSGAGPS
jgi:hypothetical protein